MEDADKDDDRKERGDPFHDELNQGVCLTDELNDGRDLFVEDEHGKTEDNGEEDDLQGVSFGKGGDDV